MSVSTLGKQENQVLLLSTIKMYEHFIFDRGQCEVQVGQLICFYLLGRRGKFVPMANEKVVVLLITWAQVYY